MAQMAAEELGVDTRRITVVDGDTARCPNTGGTGGSTGLTRGGTAVRQAAATARQALLGLAATRLKRPVADLTIVDGRGSAGWPAVAASASACWSAAGGWPCRSTPRRRSSRRRSTRASGSPRHGPMSRPSAPGRYQYIQDFSVPGMLHGRVIRPPASAPRSSRSTRRRSRSFPACASSASRASSPSWRTTSGRR